MILFQALARGAVSFFLIMSLGIAGMALRDGVNAEGLAELGKFLPDTDMTAMTETVDSWKAALQLKVSSLM